MLLLELIFPEQNLRLFSTVEGSVSVEEFRRFIEGFFELKNTCILFDGSLIEDDGKSLLEAGAHTGTGVMICEHYNG